MGQPIGIFDSGVGGLSVLRHVREMAPGADLVYVADAAWCPYGPKPGAVIRERVAAIARALLDRGVMEVVVACNSASTAALAFLRQRFPEVPFVGMEPAVKPAAAQTQTGAIGVLATATTARGEALARLVDRFGRGVAVHVAVPEGLVELVERGEGDSPAAEALLRPIAQSFAVQNVDVIVLGCTHYPFAHEAIQRVAGPAVTLIDPAPAVARQAVRVLAEAVRRAGTAVDIRDERLRRGKMTFLSSGAPETLRHAVERLMPAGWADGAEYGSLAAS
jgi:glutamate racemase